MYSLFYFVGLVMCAISVGTLNKVPEYSFLIIGGGLILYPVMVLVVYPITKRLVR